MDHHQSPHKISVRDKQSLFSEPPAPFRLHPVPQANELVSGDRSSVTRAFVLIKERCPRCCTTDKRKPCLCHHRPDPLTSLLIK